MGRASGARQVEKLTVLSPISGSAYQSILLSGSHYFDKDISKATVKIKAVHNPQHPPLTSEILLHVSFYCYFTKVLTERQGSSKKKKKIYCCSSKGKGNFTLQIAPSPFLKQQGHRDILSLLPAKFGKKTDGYLLEYWWGETYPSKNQ